MENQKSKVRPPMKPRSDRNRMHTLSQETVRKANALQPLSATPSRQTMEAIRLPATVDAATILGGDLMELAQVCSGLGIPTKGIKGVNMMQDKIIDHLKTTYDIRAAPPVKSE